MKMVDQLEEAKKMIEELQNELERISMAALEVQTIKRLSEDGKFAFMESNGREGRIASIHGVRVNDSVLVHPGTKQIVEKLPPVPVQKSRFAPTKLPKVTWDDIGGLSEAKA